jgi:hypothetical protein
VTPPQLHVLEPHATNARAEQVAKERVHKYTAERMQGHQIETVLVEAVQKEKEEQHRNNRKKGEQSETKDEDGGNEMSSDVLLSNDEGKVNARYLELGSLCARLATHFYEKANVPMVKDKSDPGIDEFANTASTLLARFSKDEHVRLCVSTPDGQNHDVEVKQTKNHHGIENCSCSETRHIGFSAVVTGHARTNRSWQLWCCCNRLHPW